MNSSTWFPPSNLLLPKNAGSEWFLCSKAQTDYSVPKCDENPWIYYFENKKIEGVLSYNWKLINFSHVKWVFVDAFINLLIPYLKFKHKLSIIATWKSIINWKSIFQWCADIPPIMAFAFVKKLYFGIRAHFHENLYAHT